MIRSTVVTGCLMLCLLLTACKTTSTEQVSGGPVLSEAQLESLKAEYVAVDPGVRVGQIIATLPEQDLAAVSGLSSAGVLEGDHITFTDQASHVIAIGKVVSVRSDSLHVQYTVPAAAGSRAPVTGDIAIRFSK